MKTLIQKDTCPMFMAVMFTIVKLWKQSKCPLVDEQIKVIHTHTGILYSAIKKWNVDIHDNMDRCWGHYAKWNKLEKDKYWVISFMCGI